VVEMLALRRKARNCLYVNSDGLIGGEQESKTKEPRQSRRRYGQVTISREVPSGLDETEEAFWCNRTKLVPAPNRTKAKRMRRSRQTPTELRMRRLPLTAFQTQDLVADRCCRTTDVEGRGIEEGDAEIQRDMVDAAIAAQLRRTRNKDRYTVHAAGSQASNFCDAHG
jgi:hypothetical protein